MKLKQTIRFKECIKVQGWTVILRRVADLEAHLVLIMQYPAIWNHVIGNYVLQRVNGQWNVF